MFVGQVLTRASYIVISEHGLDKSSSNKTYFGRQEIARLVYAALFAYTRRPNPQTRIQFIVFVLCCFFTGARISSMIGAHDQGRNDLDVRGSYTCFSLSLFLISHFSCAFLLSVYDRR